MDGVGAALSGIFTPQSAFSFLIFTLLYTPCVAAIAAIRRELNSGAKAALTALLQCMVAWVAAFLFSRLEYLIIGLVAVIFTIVVFSLVSSRKIGKCTGCSSNCTGCDKMK